MKVKVKFSPELEAKLKTIKEGKAPPIQPITRTKQPNGSAGVQLVCYVPEGMAAHITQLAQVERRTVSSICQELLGVALGLVETPEEAAASEAIIQRGNAPGATSADIAAATLESIKRSTGQFSDSDFPPMPTQDDINQRRYDPFTQQWNPNWDWKNRRWLK